MSSFIRQPTPIFGREREQIQLRELLEQAIDGNGSLVIINGEAGIGKTTLVDDLARLAGADGVLVLSGGCYDLTTTPPYGPWIELVFRSYSPFNGLPPVPDALRDLASIRSQEELFSLAMSFFQDIAAHQPLLLVLEDLHWTDLASLDLLRFVTHQVGDLPILLAVTFRDDEITRRHALFKLLPALVREAPSTRINLARLSEPEIRQLVTSRYQLNAADEERLVRHLEQLSEGNPFYAGELMEALDAEGIISQAAGETQVGSLRNVVVPPLVQQVIETRLERLDRDDQQLLEIAAVIGQEFDYDLWSTVSEVDDKALQTVIDRSLSANMVQEVPHQGSYRFQHALIRETLYERQIWPRRRSWHRQIAEYLENQPNPDPDDVAYHYQEAGDDRAIEWLINAGERAGRTFAWIVGIERYSAAAKILESDDSSQSLRGKLLTKIAQLLLYEDPARGRMYADEALNIAPVIPDLELEANARYIRGLLLCFLAEAQEGISDMRNAIELFDTGKIAPPTTAFGNSSLASYGLHLSNTGHLAEALAFFENRLGLDEPEMSGWFHSLARTYALLGRPGDARLACERELTSGLGPVSYLTNLSVTSSYIYYIYVPFYFDDIASRQSHSSRYRELLRANPGTTSFGTEPKPPPDPAIFYVDSFNWNSWLPYFQEIESFNNSFWSFHAKSFLGELARHQGLRELAWEQVVDTHFNGTATEPGTTPSFYASIMIQQLAADLCMDDGNMDDTKEWLEAHDGWMDWNGAVLGLSEGQLGWARYHLIASDIDQSRKHAERALAHAEDPRQPLALIAARRFLGDLECRAGHHDLAREYLDRSLTLAKKCEAPHEIALTKLAQARLAAATGFTQRAEELLTQVRETCETLGANLTLQWVEELEKEIAAKGHVYPAGLTAREVQVLKRVASGMTDVQVAGELYISPRTVGQHLRNIYNKIGVNNRIEATHFAIEHGLV